MIIRKLSDNTKVYIDRYFAIIDEMAEKIKGIEDGDCISELFMRQMLAIHEGGVKMSENILTYTTNSNIEALAKSIIESSNKSITSLNEMGDCCRECVCHERDVNLYQRRFNSINENILSKMNGINVTNNLDVDFLSGMIPHHEGEIAMAKNLLGYEVCAEVKTFAENLITTHDMQLSQMRQMLRILG